MPNSPFIIGIGGGTGAGKTTVAKKVREAVNSPVTVLSLDNYYRNRSHLSPAERKEINYDHPDAIEWDFLIDNLHTIKKNRPVDVPQYDFETHTRKPDAETIEPAPVVVIEGIFALYHEDVLDFFDLPVFVQTDADVRVLRRLRRDVLDRGRHLEGIIEQYLSTVKPMHEQFVEPTKRNADIIIPEGMNQTAVELLRDKITAEISMNKPASTSYLGED